jgi:broad specificity phosphatase PhoE
LVTAEVRNQLSEVNKPWYASAEEHANAVAGYLRGDVVAQWEPREAVIARLSQLKLEFESMDSVVLVSHGLFITTWLDDEIRLSDPLSFWSDLQMPDAWEVNVDKRSLHRIP